MTKCATVSVIGRPSAGKSTLINTICGNKVSITSPSPQTTRNAVRGIYTDSRGQLIFTDTPGYHISEKTINRRMMDIAASALTESDLILYVLDGARSRGREEEAIVKMLSPLKTPILAVINKSDCLSKEEVSSAREYIISKLPKAEVLSASALKDEGVDEILISLFSKAKEDVLLYPEDTWTDQSLEFRISEIIREKAIARLSAELPHAIYVEVADIEYREEEGSVWVRAFICTETKSQIGIVVGKGGENIRRIRKSAFSEIKKIFPTLSLTLDLRVKERDKWRTNKTVLDGIFNS